MTRDRDEAGEHTGDGDDLDRGFRVRVKRRSNGGLRKVPRERERDESRDKDKEERRRRHWE